jgi:hypothetical protein
MRDQKNLPTTGFTPDDEDDDPNRIIAGSQLKFNDGDWTIDGEPAPADLQLLVCSGLICLQRWAGGKVIETIPNTDGRKALTELCAKKNAKTPKDQWEPGPNGPRAPWSISYVTYLIEPSTAKRFTHANSTVGAKIAFDNLSDQIRWMSKLKGDAEMRPIVTLGSMLMPTQFGTKKPRPDFTIKGWRSFSAPTAPAPALEHAKASSPHEFEHPAAGMDEIPFDPD